MGEQVTVRKLDAQGLEVWRWSGRVLARGEAWVQIEARFNHGTLDLGYVTLRNGDRFVEWYYTDRCYNIFEVHDAEDDQVIKGWYCNITRPAIFRDDEILHEDLALDLFVYPSGRALLLDEDEFAALPLPQADRLAALAAVEQLRAEVENRRPPFDAIRDPPT
jgi:predicted RNA-binding protein associated with RNAse of E/G family